MDLNVFCIPMSPICCNRPGIHTGAFLWEIKFFKNLTVCGYKLAVGPYRTTPACIRLPGDPAAKEIARRNFRGIRLLNQVTTIPGLLPRTVALSKAAVSKIRNIYLDIENLKKIKLYYKHTRFFKPKKVGTIGCHLIFQRELLVKNVTNFFGSKEFLRTL